MRHDRRKIMSFFSRDFRPGESCQTCYSVRVRWGAPAIFSGLAFAVLCCPLLNAQTAAPASFETPQVVFASPVEAYQGSLLEQVHYLARKGHTALGYDESRRRMFSSVDNVTVGAMRGVVAVYSQVFVTGSGGSGGQYRERGDQNGDDYIDDRGMNAEHIWPQSYFKKRGPMRSDMHNLTPAFIHPNSVRGRLPFTEVSPGEADYRTNAGARRGNGGFEPPDAVKGRVARSMLYFYARYLGYNILPRSAVNDFWNRRIEMLLRWSRDFPPDAFERRRNDLVEEVQGNRNPFVDDPSLADRIGPEALRMYAGKRS